MRLGAAIALVAIALGAALALHGRHRPTAPAGWTCYAPACETRPSWEDPVAGGIAAAGIALAVALVGYGRFRRRV